MSPSERASCRISLLLPKKENADRTSLSSHSNIRQVPDNQEVYLDGDGFSSIVVEILERVETVSTDDEALEYHLRDLVEDEEDDAAEKTKVWSRGEVKCGKLPYVLACLAFPIPPTQAH